MSRSFGGRGFGGTLLNDLWRFDRLVLASGANPWQRIPWQGGELPTPRERHAAAMVDGVMYVFGGIDQSGRYLDDLWAFNTKNWEWVKVEHMDRTPEARAYHTMAVIGKIILILGGENMSQGPNNLRDTDILDTTIFRW